MGGTSIGSFIGGIYAEECDGNLTLARARELAVDMNSLWKKIIDLTYPFTAMFSGKLYTSTGVFFVFCLTVY